MIILEDGNNIAPEELEGMFEQFRLIKAVMVYESEMAGSQVIAMSVYPDYELAGDKSEEELGLSSFDLMELSCELEEHFQVKINTEDLVNVKSIEDLRSVIAAEV